MIRVTSGIVKNKKLEIPEILSIRVVQDIVKLALFSIIGDKINDADCLDLFAGSGNLGIEALSRGAKWCDFVDENYLAKETIEKNLFTCGFTDRAEVFLKDALKYVTKTQKNYDIVFLDPFYENISHRFLMKNIGVILKANGVIAFTHGQNLDMSKLIEGTNLVIETQRKFGASVLTILKTN